MKTGFELSGGGILPTTHGPAAVLVYAAPTVPERQELSGNFAIDAYDLDSALDPDEISRVEFAPNRMAVIWKRPKNAALDRNQVRFDVASLGLFLHFDRLVVVLGEDTIPFSSRDFQGVATPIDVVLRLLLHTVHHYVGHLKVIKQLTAELGNKISASLENRYLLQMVALSESLIYYQHAIEANGTVLAKLRANVERMAFSPEQIEALHGIELDNQQCARQAQIYSTVLSGLMDARGTIVNNNVNLLLKKLTLINVIFLPLTLIASIGGMSEFSMMTQGVDWRVSYAVLVLGMILLGWGTWLALVRILDRRPPGRRSIRRPRFARNATPAAASGPRDPNPSYTD
jgi:magnesium transporter